MPALLVRFPNGTTRQVELSKRPVTVGRSDHCDVQLPSEEVSREHAHVWLDEQQRVVVLDRKSKNGTRVDAGDAFRGVQRYALRTIRIGDFDLEIIGAPGGADQPISFINDDGPTGEASFFPSTRHLDLNQQRLTLMMSLAERISGVFERKQLLEQALDACVEALGFDRGMIVLKTQRGDTEAPVTRNVQKDANGAYTVSRTLINRALLHGERAIVNNLATDMVGNISESLVRFPICSALCVPIQHRDEILGVIYGDRVTQAASYSSEDVDFLAAIARQVGLGVANLRMLARHVDLQKVIEEIKRARDIQRNLLPATPLQVARAALAGYNEPSSDVGGDYFDYFPLDDGRIGFTIADVTGHGLPAALVMANFQAAVHVALTADEPLDALGARLNRLVVRNTAASVFVTAIVGRLDPRTGELEFVNAGHPGPIIIRRAATEAVTDGQALPFGIDPDEAFHVQRLKPGGEPWSVLFYTDGLIEAENPVGEQLGAEPVAQALAAGDAPPPQAVLQATLDIVQRHLGDAKNRDDLTLLAMHLE